MSLHNDLRHPNFSPLELLVRINMWQDYCLIKNIIFFLVLKKNPSRITIGRTIIHRVFETNSSFPREIAHCGKSSISIFQEFFASVQKIFILAGGLRTRLSFHGG